MLINSKKSFRRLYSSIRNGIDKALKEEYSKRIITSLINAEKYKSNQNILIYVSFGSEIQTNDIIDYSLKNNKSVYIPFWNDGTMDFYMIKNRSELMKDKNGFLIPDISKCEKLENGCEALCVVPGLSFDRFGNRLGYGGGYYDRFLALNPQITPIALCFDRCLCSGRLPTEKHDIIIPVIITETSVIRSET